LEVYSYLKILSGSQPLVYSPGLKSATRSNHTIAGNNNDALVIPPGLAFAKAIGKRPELEFYQPDKRHPTLIGTYLAASTAYASIYKKSPIDNAYMASIDPKKVQTFCNPWPGRQFKNTSVNLSAYQRIARCR